MDRHFDAELRQAAGVSKDAVSRDVNTTAGSATSVSVMLIVADASSAFAWYERALGARELWNLGSVMGLEIGGAPFFLHEINPDNPTETSPLEAGRTSMRIELFVDDPDALLERATAAGATLSSPIEDHLLPWGTHRQGGFQDPFGHKWSVGDKSPLRAHPS
jgi:PhnB protein